MDHETLLSIYKVILDYLDVGVHAVDDAGKTIIYNQKMMDIEGMEIEDVLDKNILDVFQFFQGEESILLQILKSGEPLLNFKQKYFNNKGMEINTVHSSYPIKMNHRTVAAVEIVRDVTKLERILGSMNHNSRTYSFEHLEMKKYFPEDIIETAKQAVALATPLMIIGEHGTHKKILAQCIHDNSSAEPEKFHSQNCLEVAEPYHEKLLFGEQDQAGMLENACGGTLLLQEIHLLPITTQQKLLNCLKKKQVRRLGENIDRNITLRMIGDLSEDPITVISEGKLLKELYYFLSQSSLVIPPLRSRKKDIYGITMYLIKKFNERFQMKVSQISKEVRFLLEEYDWPGNIKELEHIIEDTMKLMKDEEKIELHHLPTYFTHKTAHENEFLLQKDRDIKPLEEYLQETESYYIQKALQLHDYNITKTAMALQMSRQNLQYRMKKHGITKKEKPQTRSS